MRDYFHPRRRDVASIDAVVLYSIHSSLLKAEHIHAPSPRTRRGEKENL